MRKPQLRRWRRPCGNTTTSAIRSRKPGSLPIRPPCPTRASPRGATAWNRRRTASTASSRRPGTTARGLPMAKRRRRWFPPSRPRWKAKRSPLIPEEIYPRNGANTEQAPCGRKKHRTNLRHHGHRYRHRRLRYYANGLRGYYFHADPRLCGNRHHLH